ncbi:MAG: hypothetical protein WD045_01625 [Pirellulaceae bacterium]
MCRDREFIWILILATLASSAGCFGVRFHDPVYEPPLNMPWHAMSGLSAQDSCETSASSIVEPDEPSIPKHSAGKQDRPVLPAWSAPPHSKFHPVPARPVFAPATVLLEPPRVAVREISTPQAPSRLHPEAGLGDSPLELNAPARLSDASIDEATPIR